MSIDDIITAVLKREGGSKATNDPLDHGGRTQFGIAEASNPRAWADNKVTEVEARAIYRKKYVEGPGFDAITDPHIMSLLVDWGVTSGPAIAIKGLQRVVGTKEDGVLGNTTLSAVASGDSKSIVNRLVAERIKMIGRIVNKNPSQSRFVLGWLTRAADWLS